jgi:WhiB family transcriptional regulator, redox-sensing transcriptional regulator
VSAPLPAELVARVRRLRRLRQVPDEVLAARVAAEGLIRVLPEAPAVAAAVESAAGPVEADRAVAALLCAGCPVADECLELEFRWMADRTLGVFAALPEADRRAAYPLWRAQRDATGRTAGPG